MVRCVVSLATQRCPAYRALSGLFPCWGQRSRGTGDEQMFSVGLLANMKGGELVRVLMRGKHVFAL